MVDAALDVEVEVDTDPLEERVGERDEPHLDRDLEVLEAAELFEEVRDLLVHLLRLADDEAQIGLERPDRARASLRVPGLLGHRALDQIHEGLKVLLPATRRRWAERNRRRRAGHWRASAAQLQLGERGGIERAVAACPSGIDSGGSRADLHGKIVPHGDLVVAIAQGAGDAEAVGSEVGDRQHEVGHGIGDGVDVSLHEPGARDLEDLVPDDVTEVERLEQEPEGTLQRDRLVEGERDRGVAADRLLIKADHVEVDRYVGLFRQGVDHDGQRLAAVARLHLGVELLENGDLGRRCPRATFRQPLRPRLCQVLPILRLGKLDRSSERRARRLHILGDIEEPGLTLAINRLLGVEAANHPALGEQLPYHGVIGGELPGLLGDRFCFGEPPLVHERVVFLDEHGDALVDLHLLRPLAVDLGFDLARLLLHGEFVPPLAGGFLDVAAGAFDSPEDLGLGLLRQRLVVESLGGRVEQVEGIGRRLLREPLGLELLGGHLGRDAGYQEAVGSGCTGWGGLRGRARGGWIGRLADRVLDHPAGSLFIERLGLVRGR